MKLEWLSVSVGRLVPPRMRRRALGELPLGLFKLLAIEKSQRQKRDSG